MQFKTLNDINLRGQRVFIRCDLNVPLDARGRVSDDTRIRASLDGIRHALAQRARVMVTSHLGRPAEVFEIEQFSYGTRTLAAAIAESRAYTIAGGGDTVAAINRFDVAECIDYVSTAGGACLEFLEGKTLPAVQALVERSH